MKNFLILFLVALSTVCLGQSTVQLRGDTIKIWKNGGTSELIIQNSTKDSTNGVLTNAGSGRTTFLKFRTSQDSLFLGNIFIGLVGSKETVINFDYPSSYVIVNGDTTDILAVQYLNDSVKVRKSGDTLFFPNGDTLYLGDATPSQRGLVSTTTQGFAGEKNFIDKITIGQQFSTTKKGELELLTSTSGGLGSYSFRIKDRGQTTANEQGLLFDVFRDQSSNRGIAYVTGNQENDKPIFKISGAGVRINQNRKNIISELRPDSAEIVNEGLGGIQIGGGSTTERPASSGAGSIRYNTDSSGIEWYNGSAWRVLGSGGGSSSITTGYGLLGDGSGGNPARVDSATLRGDYIRNQYAAKESKSAWFTKVRLDSLHSTKVALGAIDPTQINQIFLGIDTGSSPFEGYMYHRMGYRNRVVDRISRARGSHASPTSLIVGDPLYTEQISMYGSAGYTTPFTFHDVWLKSVPTSTTGTSIYQRWASGPSTTNVALQLDSNGVKIGRGLPSFSATYDSAKNSLDVIGSFGTRVRSVTGTAHTATTNDHTLLISADGGSSFVLTLPNPATAPRREYVIKRVDSTLNLAYMKPTAGKVEGLDSMFIDRFSWVTIQSDSVNWHVVSRSSDTRLDALEQARNGFSYYQEFISNVFFTDGYIFGNASGAGSGIGRNVNVPVGLQATNRPGITYARAGTTTTGRSGFYSDLNNRDNIILGASTVVYENTIAFPDLSDGTDRYQAIFGLHDVAGVNATDGVYFLYDEGGVSTGSAASGNWQIVTASAASRTFTTTSTAVAANTWYRLRIEINKTASEVRFYINGTLVGTHTTTIPSGVDRGTILQASINKSAGTNDRVFAIDYLLLNMRFNSPRY